MKTMRWMNGLLVALALVAGGCGLLQKDKFEVGGAYAQTETRAALPDLYVADAAFDLAWKSLDAAFKFEQANRMALWTISPKIKHNLDTIRPAAALVWMDYAGARQTYLSMPTEANLTTLQTVLAKLQQYNTTALTVIATKGN